MRKISLQQNWREILFSVIMCVVLIIACGIFAKEPSMATFMKGSYLLGSCFALTFFFCSGHSLPNKKTWQTFGDTVTICLGVMLVAQTVLTILSYKAFDIISGGQCFAIVIGLILVYLLVFFLFVIQFCDYKEYQEEKTQTQ